MIHSPRINPKWLLGGALLMLAQTALATSHAKEQSPYLYAGLETGWMHYQNACEPWRISCDADDIAYGLHLGYQYRPWLGFELGYLDLGEAQAVYRESGVDQDYRGTMRGWQLAWVGRYAVTDNWDLYAKVGSLAWHGKHHSPYGTITDNGWAPLFGLGAEYALAEQWRLGLEYRYIDQLGSDKLGGSNGHLTTLALRYRFGEEEAEQATAAPEPVVPHPLPAQITRLPAKHWSVWFGFDSHQLPASMPDLDQIRERLQQVPQSRVQIRGYTDATGHTNYNQHLAQQRTQAVADYLIQQGIPATRLDLSSLGEEFPAQTHVPEAQKQQSRRVDILLPAATLSTQAQ